MLSINPRGSCSITGWTMCWLTTFRRAAHSGPFRGLPPCCDVCCRFAKRVRRGSACEKAVPDMAVSGNTASKNAAPGQAPPDGVREVSRTGRRRYSSPMRDMDIHSTHRMEVSNGRIRPLTEGDSIRRAGRAVLVALPAGHPRCGRSFGPLHGTSGFLRCIARLPARRGSWRTRRMPGEAVPGRIFFAYFPSFGEES